MTRNPGRLRIPLRRPVQTTGGELRAVVLRRPFGHELRALPAPASPAARAEALVTQLTPLDALEALHPLDRRRVVDAAAELLAEGAA